jgi:hypothetical protein
MPLPAVPRPPLPEARPGPLLERFGVQFFRRRAARLPPLAAGSDLHLLDASEHAALRRIERGAILRGALAGALSALVSAVAEMRAPTATFVLITVAAAALELAFLYWDALRTVHGMARAIGLEPVPPGQPQPARLAPALVRAALELPSPPDGVLGVNPYRRASRLALLAASVLYKLKIGLTNFVFRAVLRRLLGRSALRTYLPLIAVPVTALWNGLVVWWILRQARIRLLGPSAGDVMLAAALGRASGPSRALDEAVLRAVGSVIVRKRDMHPNLAHALEFVSARLERPEVPDVDDETRFLAALGALPQADRPAVLEVLRVAIVLDGRITRHDRALWRAAAAVAGVSPDVAPLYQLRGRFLRGDARGI